MKTWHIVLCSAFCILPLFCFSQNRKIDSLLSVVKTAKADTSLVKTYNELSKQLRRVGSFNEALDNSRLALALAQKLNFSREEAIAYNGIGMICYNLGNFPEALQNYFAALKIFEETGNKQGIAVSSGNMGIIYASQGNLDEALKSFSKALKILEAIGEKTGIVNAYINIGVIYKRQGKYMEALEKFKAGLKISLEAGDAKGTVASYSNIGNVYSDMGDINMAFDYYEQSIKTSITSKDKRGICVASLNLGILNFGLKRYTESKKLVDEALNISMEIGSKEDIKDCYYQLSRIDSVNGDFRRSLEYYRQFVAMRDSLFNEENTKKTVQAQMQYEFDKQQSADSIRNAEQVKQEELKHTQEIKQQKIYTYGGIAGFLLMIIVAGVSFRAYKSKQKANEIISAQKVIVEEKQKEILDSIYYAQRIQRSLLPSEKYIHRNLWKHQSGKL